MDAARQSLGLDRQVRTIAHRVDEGGGPGRVAHAAVDGVVTVADALQGSGPIEIVG